MTNYSEMFSEADFAHMRTALDLAWQGRFSTSPNPRVGCVLVRGGQVVGQGFHLRAGEPHAEVHALRQAGAAAQGATAYVTLEPCSHTGRTGPCAQALINAGVARVVAAMVDPNPLVAGRGVDRLRAAGVRVDVGLLAEEARALNEGFLSRIERGRPFLRWKIAASADGKSALGDGRSQWITAEPARADVQQLRAQSCAVLTGVGTVLADNPRLTVRAGGVLRQPVRVIFDSRLRTPLSSHVVCDGAAETWMVTTVADARRHAPYLAHGQVRVEVVAADAQGRIDLAQALARLAEKGLGDVLVEAGAQLGSALMQGGWIDECVVYLAPKFLGETARAAFRLPENAAALEQAQWQTHSVAAVGNDIRWVLRPARGASVDAAGQKR